MDVKMTTSSSGKFYVIPQDANDYDILGAVSAKTRSDVEMKYGFYMDSDWQTNTVANCVVETMLGEMNYKFGSGNGTSGIGVSFFDLFSAKISLKTNGKAEKEGNINIYFEPGSRVRKLIEEGPPKVHSGPRINPVDELLTDDQVENDFLLQLDKHASYELNRCYGIMITSKKTLITTAITLKFFENLFTELIVRATADTIDDDGSEKLVTVNFNDIIEIHVAKKGDDMNVYMRPGMNAKLLIKNDQATEHTLGDIE